MDQGPRLGSEPHLLMDPLIVVIELVILEVKSALIMRHQTSIEQPQTSEYS